MEFFFFSDDEIYLNQGNVRTKRKEWVIWAARTRKKILISNALLIKRKKSYSEHKESTL